MTKTFLSYQEIESMLERFVEPLRKCSCDVVVAILRGGLFPAHYLANELGLPIRFIQFDRDQEAPAMLGELLGKRVLLVDDSCCTGRTMTPCKSWLEERGYEVVTCTIFAVRPSKVDFAVEAEASPVQEWVVPWERRIFTPQARMLRQGGNYLPMDDAHLACHGWDLDGIFVSDIDSQMYDRDLEAALAMRDGLAPFVRVPAVDWLNAVIITARPVCDAERTRDWWRRHFPSIPMHFRDDKRYGNSCEEVARYKADTALALGVTHFVESDLEIATLIALRAPLLRVQWLNPQNHIPIAISAWDARHVSVPIAA